MNKLFKKVLSSMFILTMLITTGAVKQWGFEEVYAEEGQHEYSYEVYKEATCVSPGISHRYCVNHSKEENGIHVPDPTSSGYDATADAIKDYEFPATGKHVYTTKKEVGNGYEFYCEHSVQGSDKYDPKCATTEAGSESGNHTGIFFTDQTTAYHIRTTAVTKAATCSSEGYIQSYCLMHSKVDPATGKIVYSDSKDITNIGAPGSTYDIVKTTVIQPTRKHVYNISFEGAKATYTCEHSVEGSDKYDPNCANNVFEGHKGIYSVENLVSDKDDGRHTNWKALDANGKFTDNSGNKILFSNQSGSYYLTADVNLSANSKETIILDNKDISLCLNGHSLTMGSKVIFIKNNSTLRIFDHNGTGKITSSGTDAYDNKQNKLSDNLGGGIQNYGTLLLSGVNYEYTYSNGVAIDVNGSSNTTLTNGTVLDTKGVGISAKYNYHSTDNVYSSGTPKINISNTTINETGNNYAISLLTGSGAGKSFGADLTLDSGSVINTSYYSGAIQQYNAGTVSGNGTPGINKVTIKGNAKIYNSSSTGVGVYSNTCGTETYIKDNAYIEANTGVKVYPAGYDSKVSDFIVDISGSAEIKSNKYGISFEKSSSSSSYNYSGDHATLKMSGTPKIHGNTADINLMSNYYFNPAIEIYETLVAQDGGYSISTEKNYYESKSNYNDGVIVKANSTDYTSSFNIVGKTNTKLSRIDNVIYLEKCEHNFVSFDRQEATDTIDGYNKKYCTICNALKTEVIKASGNHVFDDNYYQDDENNHYRVCKNDGFIEITLHVFNKYTDQNDGTHMLTCGDCGYQKDPVEHTWGTSFTKDDDGLRHYVTCTAKDCGARNYFNCYFTDHYSNLGNGTHDAYCVCGNKINETHKLVVVPEESKSPTPTENGIETTICVCDAKRVRVPGLTSFGKVDIIIPNEGDTLYPESDHNYQNNLDETKYFSYPGVERLIIKFNGLTETERNYDKITITYNSNGKDETLINQVSGSDFKNNEYEIPTDNFKIRLTSDYGSTRYGYAFEYIKATVSNEKEEENSDLLKLTTPAVGAENEESGIYKVYTFEDKPTLNIRTAWVADKDAEAPVFEEESYAGFMKLVGTNKVTTKTFTTNQEAASYRLDFGVPGYYAVRIKYQENQDIKYTYQIIKVENDTSNYQVPEIMPDENDSGLTFTDDNIQKVYIGKANNDSVIVKENGKVVGTTVNSYEGFIQNTSSFILKAGDVIKDYKYSFEDPGYYLVRIKYTNKLGLTDYVYSAFEVTDDQVNYGRPLEDDNTDDGVITVTDDTLISNVSKIYVGYLGSEENNEWDSMDFTNYTTFTTNALNFFQVSQDQLKNYKFYATEPGWYAVRIKYTKDDKVQYRAFLYQVKNVTKNVPAIEKTEENSDTFVIGTNGDCNYSLNKVYVGYAKDQDKVDNYYLTEMNKGYDKYMSLVDNVKLYSGNPLDISSFSVTKDGVYLVRVKYLDGNNNAKYVYDVFRVNGAFSPTELLVSVNGNNVTVTVNRYKVKSVKFVKCDAMGNVLPNDEFKLESTETVNKLPLGLYLATVVDEHNNEYTALVNVKFENNINENYVTALRGAINNTNKYLSKIAITDTVAGAVKYSGLSVSLGEGKIGAARTVDYNNYLKSYLDNANKVLTSLNNSEGTYTQEEVNKVTNSLNSALSTFKTKVVTNLVSVSGDTISSGLEVDGDSVAYMYVANGIHLDYNTMSTTSGFVKVLPNGDNLSISGLVGGVYTVRTKVTPAEGNAYYIYTYCYVGNDLVNGLKNQLNVEIDTTRTTKLASALDDDEQLKDSLKSNKAAVKLFNVFTNAKGVAASSNDAASSNVADECLFAAIDLIKTSSDTPSGLGSKGQALQRDVTFTLTGGSKHVYNYTANSLPTEKTVIVANEGETSADVHIKASNIINYRIAYGEFTEEDGYAAMEASGITSYTTSENTYKAKYNGVYTLRIKWSNSTYTYQTFEVTGIPEPLKLEVEGSNINATLNGSSLGTVTLVQYLYGSNVSNDSEFFTEFNADNDTEFKNMTINGLGNGVHTFKVTVVKSDGTNMTYLEQAKITEQNSMTLKQDTTRIGFFANKVEDYLDVKYKELDTESEFFHTSLNKMISADTFDTNKTYLLEVGPKDDQYKLSVEEGQFKLKSYSE